MEINYREIGGRIRKLREARDLTQEGLAELAGITPTYQSHIERGEKRPSLGVLVRKATALDVTVDRLLAGFQPADRAAFLTDVEELMSRCTLQERRIIMAAAVAIKDAMR